MATQEQNISIEDLFGNQRDIAEIIGIENLTERYIRSLCSDLTMQRRHAPPNQLNIFDL